MNYDVKLVAVKSLRPSPKTLAIHPPFEPDGRDHLLVESIRAKGIVEPLKVHADGTIEDGYRRSESARFLKIAKVPVHILADGIEIFEDMQLGRQLSVFAVCSLQRVRIEELVTRGIALPRGVVAKNCPDSSAESNELKREWDRLEQVFGKSQDTLQSGVIVLSRIDELHGVDAKRGAAAENSFRQYGLKAVMGLFDLWDGKHTTRAEAAAKKFPDEVDAAGWDYESDELLPPELEKPQPEPKKSPAAEQDSDTPTEPETLPAWNPAWLQRDKIETYADHHGRLTAALRKALDLIESLPT